MALTHFDTTTNLRVTRQDPRVWLYGQSNTFFGKFVGPMGKARKNDSGDGVIIETSANAIVQLSMEFTKAKGDRVTIPLRVPLYSAGVTADGDLEGTEEELTFHDFSFELKSTGHAVRGSGDLSDRRVAFNVKGQAKEALTEWMGRQIDYYVLCAMSGLATPDGNVAAVAPAATRRWIGGQTAAGAVAKVAALEDLNVATDYLFGPQVITTVKRMAQLSVPKVRPVTIGGKDHYVMFIHPYQVKALKATTEWGQIHQNASVRGEKNPIFTGALGMYDNVWLHEWERIETRDGDGAGIDTYFDAGDAGTPLDATIDAARALFCGAQSVIEAFGRTPRALAKQFDYNRKWGVGMDCHLAVAKPVFDSLDYGVIAVDTCIVPD